jgi:hypothetical protein
LSRH